jgi:DNA repair protein SbcD/Mre11
MLRILHTADWHLGARLYDWERTEEHGAFLEWLCGVIASERVDLLVIAGDLFDSANPTHVALAQWYDFVSDLRAVAPNCKVVVTAGNHDSAQGLEAARRMLALCDVHVVGQMPSPAAACLVPFPTAENPEIVIAAVPFLRDRDLRGAAMAQSGGEIEEQLRTGIRDVYAACEAAALPWLDRGAAYMALGHLTALGGHVSQSERDIHVGNLGAVDATAFGERAHYVALGHLHRPQAVGGWDTRRYAGSPIPLSFSEVGHAKEVRLLDFDQGKLIQQRAMTIPLRRELRSVVTTREAMRADLLALPVSSAPLPTWIELTLAATSETMEALHAEVADIMVGRHAEVVSWRRAALAGASVPRGEAMAELTPPDVFASVLEESQVAESERAELVLTFQRLWEAHQSGDAVV